MSLAPIRLLQNIPLASYLFLAVCLFLGPVPSATADPQGPLRVGMIGLDTSHVISFTKIINDPQAAGDLADIEIVAAYPGGSPSFPPSRDRVEGFTKQVAAMGIEIVDSIPALLSRVDVVMLESVDGSQHLDQVRPVFEAKKRVFIDKPFTASLVDAIAIAELSKRHAVPFFSASGKRYQQELTAPLDASQLGKILGCDVYGTSKSVPNHPDLFWYGIHGCEVLYTVLGTGCVTVTAHQTPTAEQVCGIWKDGQVGTFRGIREGGGRNGFGMTVFSEKKIIQSGVGSDKKALLQEMARFFKTGKPPLLPATTVEIIAFMEAGETSKRLGGKPVQMSAVMKKARLEALKKIALKQPR